MGSKGRMTIPSQQHQQRHPLQPGMGILQHHPDPYGPAPVMRPLPPAGGYPYDMMMHPPEIMERKLEAQHLEIKKLVIENQRLAASHNSLRHELATSQHELQRLQGHMDAAKAEEEQNMRGMMEKMSKMEADLKSSESIKLDLQKAHAEAQSLVGIRQDLIAKVQSMSQDLQRSVGEVQQMPALMSELDSLRQEYQNYRGTYEYERKLRMDHYESLQVMERNYVSMVREMEKLRAQLTNSTGVAYNSNTVGQKENDTSAQVAQVHGMQVGQVTNNNPGPSPNPNPNPNPMNQPQYDPTQAQVAYYGTTQPYYATAQVQQNVYGAQQYMYGAAQAQVLVPNPYGLTQVPAQQQVPVQNPYGSVQYASAQPQNHATTQGQNRK